MEANADLQRTIWTCVSPLHFTVNARREGPQADSHFFDKSILREVDIARRSTHSIRPLTLLEPELCNICQYFSSKKKEAVLKVSDLRKQNNTRRC